MESYSDDWTHAGKIYKLIIN